MINRSHLHSLNYFVYDIYEHLFTCLKSWWSAVKIHEIVIPVVGRYEISISQMTVDLLLFT